MMSNDEYEDWFGIPLLPKDEIEKKIKDEKKEEVEINKKFQNNSKENNNDNSDKSLKKNFLSKKRNNSNSIEENNNIKSDKKENFKTIKNNNINNISININENKEDNIQNNDLKTKKEKNEDRVNNDKIKINYINDKYDPNHHIIKEYNSEDKAIIEFLGLKNNNNNNSTSKKLRHYIYLRTQNDFNSESEKMEYKWKITFSCNTQYIGIGVADKHVVLQNNNMLKSDKEGFYEGAFFLYSIFNEQKKTNLIFQMHPKDKNLNKYAANFVPFEKDQEVTIIYNTFHKTLTFFAKMKNKKIKYKPFTIKNITSKGPSPRTIFTPCIIFYYPGDTIQISNLESFKYIESNN